MNHVVSGNGNHYHTLNVSDTIYVVVIDDHSDFIVQTRVESAWQEWHDAAAEVHRLNKDFMDHGEHDFHAYYKFMTLHRSTDWFGSVNRGIS